MDGSEFAEVDFVQGGRKALWLSSLCRTWPEVMERYCKAAVDFLFFPWGLWGLQISGLWISGSGIRNAFFILMLHTNELTNLISLNPAISAGIGKVVFCLFWYLENG